MGLAAIIISVIALVIGNSYFILGYIRMDSLGLDAATVMSWGVLIAFTALMLSIISLIYHKVKKRKLKESVIALVVSIIAIVSPFIVTVYLMAG